MACAYVQCILDILVNVKEAKKNQPKKPCRGRARVAVVDVCGAADAVLGCTPVVVCVALHFSPAADTLQFCYSDH
jgi:hypothetical protein